MVTIGISGHRRPEQLGDTDRLKRLMKDRFAKIRSEMEEVNGPVRFVLLSPLADGADRLFVESLWEVEPGARLIVPLPFDRDAYEKTFLNEDSHGNFRAILADPRCLEHFVVPGGREGDFLRVGRWVVDHADVMFFLHDGPVSGDAALDGGTASVIRYARSIDDGAGAKEKDQRSLYVTIDTKEVTGTVRGKVTRNPHLRHLHGAGGDASPTDREGFFQRITDVSGIQFDEPAGRHQKRFSRGTTGIVTLAFLIGLIVVLDWYTDGNHFFQGLGAFLYAVNWDALCFLGLALLLGLVYRMRNRGALTDWLEVRYLAERMRSMPTLLEAAIPLSTVLTGRRGDPTRADLARAWQSLFISWQEAARKLEIEALAPDALRTRLTERDGLFGDQIRWHLKTAADKARTARRWSLLRNVLFALSMLTSLVAAGFVIGGQDAQAVFSDNADLVSNTFSLLLAGIATLAQLKEHGKLSTRYKGTSRALAGLRRTIQYTETGNTSRHAAELRDLVLEGTEILMQTTYTWMYTMEQKEPGVA